MVLSTSNQWNGSILDSIPIKREFKRLIILKFRHLCRYNGDKYASDVYSSARNLLMRFLAEEISRDEILDQFPLGKRICDKILPSVKAAPHAWLNLFKLYTSFKEPVMSVSKSQEEMSARLMSRLSGTRYKVPNLGIRIRTPDREGYEYTLPDPSWYKDFGEDYSSQYEDDVGSLLNLCLSTKYQWLFEPLDSMISDLLDFDWTHDSTYVGQIHHIPKKGTVKRRPIAVPNRFFQTAFQPFNTVLRDFLKKIPGDCTFDQGKFVRTIQDRIDHDKYVGSVDLSAASDNLPRYLALDYIRLMEDTTLNRYCDAIDRLCEDQWWNGGDTFVSFHKGQPLGLLPSFPLLAIANHVSVWLAAREINLSYRKALRSYCLLGDDIVFFNKQLRESYIKIMEALEVPLSLHKSYENPLVEFAGRIFVKNQRPVYTPDHTSVQYHSLFDYQRASGVVIRWDNLPLSIRKRWTRKFSSENEAIRGYNLVVALETFSGPGVSDTALPLLVQHLISDRVDPEPIRSARLVPLYGTVVKTSEDGFAQRDPKQSDWWKKKFRPIGTTAFKTAALATLDDLSQSS